MNKKGVAPTTEENHKNEEGCYAVMPRQTTSAAADLVESPFIQREALCASLAFALHIVSVSSLAARCRSASPAAAAGAAGPIFWPPRRVATPRLRSWAAVGMGFDSDMMLHRVKHCYGVVPNGRPEILRVRDGEDAIGTGDIRRRRRAACLHRQH